MLMTFRDNFTAWNNSWGVFSKDACREITAAFYSIVEFWRRKINSIDDIKKFLRGFHSKD
jgi:hypothetical protein